MANNSTARRGPPQINTYHCLCSSLVLATTHTLSTLPRRRSNASLDRAIILPVPSPSLAARTVGSGEGDDDEDHDAYRQTPAELPVEGVTTLCSITRDHRPVVVRKDDGFERRLVWRCARCRLVVAYEIENELGREKGKEKDSVMYLLPGGLQGTESMVMGQKITEADVEIGKGKGVGVRE